MSYSVFISDRTTILAAMIDTEPFQICMYNCTNDASLLLNCIQMIDETGEHMALLFWMGKSVHMYSHVFICMYHVRAFVNEPPPSKISEKLRDFGVLDDFTLMTSKKGC